MWLMPLGLIRSQIELFTFTFYWQVAFSAYYLVRSICNYSFEPITTCNLSKVTAFRRLYFWRCHLSPRQHEARTSPRVNLRNLGSRSGAPRIRTPLLSNATTSSWIFPGTNKIPTEEFRSLVNNYTFVCRLFIKSFSCSCQIFAEFGRIV